MVLSSVLGVVGVLLETVSVIINLKQLQELVGRVTVQVHYVGNCPHGPERNAGLRSKVRQGSLSPRGPHPPNTSPVLCNGHDSAITGSPP